MTQLTIRKLDPLIIDELKKRAATAGHSMEEGARRILRRAVPEAQLAHQRAWRVNASWITSKPMKKAAGRRR